MKQQNKTLNIKIININVKMSLKLTNDRKGAECIWDEGEVLLQKEGHVSSFFFLFLVLLC